MTIHGSDIRVLPQDDSHIEVWQRRLFDRAEIVTSVSRELLDDAINLYPSILPKGHVVYNGIEQFWFEGQSPQTTEATGYVLFVGRLHATKGVDVLLRAWALCHSRLPKLELWLVGDGPEKNALVTLSEELGIQGTVMFLGRKTVAEVRSLYAKAQLVVLPSHHEGLGMVLLEAGASGAILVGTRVPGIREVIVDGVTGLLVEPNSPDALAAGIVQTAEMRDDQRRRMSAATRQQMCTRFSHAVVTSQYLDLYRSLVGPKESSAVPGA